MDFIQVDDIARVNLLAMGSVQQDAVYNVASGVETSLLQLSQTLTHVTGAYHLQPEFLPPRKVNPVPTAIGGSP